MSKILYKNAQGHAITAHSHSGGGDFSCPKRYYWKRVQGYQSKEERPALEFGKAVESAIQFHHNKGFIPESGVEEFKLLWWKQKDSQLDYTLKTGNWEDHYKMGVDLLKLYELTRPSLPIQNEQFQVRVKNPLFAEGSPDEGLEYLTILDMVCEVDSNHPLLPPVENPGLTRKLIIDIKTSAVSFYTDSRLSALDDQLRDYSWATGIETVAFLVLVKNHSDFTVGDWVTVLSGPDTLKKYQILTVDDSRMVVLNKTEYDDFQARKKEIKGAGAKAAAEALLTEYVYKGKRFTLQEVTKQRIQFLPAIIKQEDRDEAEYEARREALEISHYGEMNYWPKKPGVRFPNNVCQSCECLGLCLSDQAMISEKLVKIDGVY